MMMAMGSSPSKINTTAQSAFKPYERLEDSPKMTNHFQVMSIEEENEYFMQKIQELANGKMKLFARELAEQAEESRRMKRESKRPMKSSLSDDEFDKQDEESRRMKRESKRPMKSLSFDDEFDRQVEESRRMKRESKRPMKSLSPDDEVDWQVEESRRMKRESKRPMKSLSPDDEVDWQVEESRRMKRESKRPMKSSPSDEELFDKQVKDSKKRKIKIESKQCPVKKPSVFEDEEANKKKMKKKKIRKIQKEIEKRLIGNPLITNEVTERLQAYISNVLNGSDIMPVIQKLLYSSDIKPDQNRLSMPINQLIRTSEFLTPQEKSMLANGGEKDVPLLGPTLQMYKQPMRLMIWEMVSTQSYVLKTSWSGFVKDNVKDLKENSIVQVWSFRRGKELCLALAVVEGPDPRFSVEEGSSSSS